ncbi:hypothetical protein [Streptomyces sp. NPDC013187]|uniref:hypothetical protein n=1 Tax=Streptomyces sp. NPDC013187 TaxID=3364865 RepID=UPI00367F62BA
MNRREKGLFGGMTVLAVVLLALLLRSCGDGCDDVAATPKTTVTITATPSSAGSQIGKSVDSALERARQTGLRVVVHDASDQDKTPGGDWTVCFEKATLSKVDFAAVPDGAPCPEKDGQRIPWPKMPDVKGTTYAEAVEKLGDAVGAVVIKAAYEDEAASDTNNEVGDYAHWKVCFQSVRVGTRLDHEPDITLLAVQEGEACPSSKGLYKIPENDPDYVDPDYVDPGNGSSDDGSNGDSGSSEEDYYPGDKGGCPPGGCHNPCPPGGCR